MSDDATAPAEGARTPVSIVCVFNDPDVLASCLQRSIEAGRVDAPETQFLPVDNRDGAFATAGAALNHGAAQAENDVIVFVHQDVYLHSLVELERVAGELLADASVGVVGAAGIDAHKRIQGRIRDRVIALGAAAPTWRDVESMDEVLFMITRRQWADEPLADQASLGWHAYAVEYSARMRSRGRRAVVRDIPLTHNSLTVNLDRLDVAHRWVGDAYPDLLPLQTTCGTIEAGGSRGGWSRLRRKAQGLARWGRESRAAVRAQAPVTLSDIVLADVRFVIDELARRSGSSSIRAADLRSAGTGGTAVDGLTRFGLPFAASSEDRAGMQALIAQRKREELLILTNLESAVLSAFELEDRTYVVGHSQEAGLWLAVGVQRDDLAELLPARRSRPYAGLIPTRPRTEAVETA